MNLKEFKTITLCGSTKFKSEFLEVQKILTLQGNIVISVGLFGHSGDDEVWTGDKKDMLDRMHKRKIDMADEIFIIDVNGYIGESTKNEIEYAKEVNKPIRYLSKEKIKLNKKHIHTPKEFAEEMKFYQTKYHDDEEAVHSLMDNTMKKLLRSLGYGEGIDIFDNTHVNY